MIYNSEHFSCEEIDERLLKGYYNDTVQYGFGGTKQLFNRILAGLKTFDLTVLYPDRVISTLAEAISVVNTFSSYKPVGIRIIFGDRSNGPIFEYIYKGGDFSSIDSWYPVLIHVTMTLAQASDLNLWRKYFNRPVGKVYVKSTNSGRILGTITQIEDDHGKGYIQVLESIYSNPTDETVEPIVGESPFLFKFSRRGTLLGYWTSWKQTYITSDNGSSENLAISQKRFTELLHYSNDLSTKIDNLYNIISALEVSGLSLENSFGNNSNIGISQKFLTETFQGLYNKINSLKAGLFGATVVSSATLVESNKNTHVSILVSTNDNSSASRIEFSTGNGTEILQQEFNVKSSTLDIVINSTTVVGVQVSLGGIIYSYEVTIEAIIPSYIGGAYNVSQAVTLGNKYILNQDKLYGKYTVNFMDNDYLFILLPPSVELGRLTMSGYDIPITGPADVTIDGILYKYYQSVNRYSSGTYDIVISGYSSALGNGVSGGSIDVDFTEIQQQIDLINTMILELTNNISSQSSNIAGITTDVNSLISDVGVIQASITSIQLSLNQINNTITTLVNRCNSYDQSIENINTAINQLSTRVSTIEDNSVNYGPTEDRPEMTIESDYGKAYFDTTLGYMIYWNGSNWVDSTGSIIL